MISLKNTSQLQYIVCFRRCLCLMLASRSDSKPVKMTSKAHEYWILGRLLQMYTTIGKNKEGTSEEHIYIYVQWFLATIRPVVKLVNTNEHLECPDRNIVSCEIEIERIEIICKIAQAWNTNPDKVISTKHEILTLKKSSWPSMKYSPQQSHLDQAWNTHPDKVILTKHEILAPTKSSWPSMKYSPWQSHLDQTVQWHLLRLPWKIYQNRIGGKYTFGLYCSRKVPRYYMATVFLMLYDLVNTGNSDKILLYLNIDMRTVLLLIFLIPISKTISDSQNSWYKQIKETYKKFKFFLFSYKWDL